MRHVYALTGSAIVGLFLCGCTAHFQLGRTKSEVTREEIAEAFQERDKVLADITKFLSTFVEKKDKK